MSLGLDLFLKKKLDVIGEILGEKEAHVRNVLILRVKNVSFVDYDGILEDFFIKLLNSGGFGVVLVVFLAQNRDLLRTEL